MAAPTHTAPRPFVDRERELETMSALVADARIGRGGLVVLCGAPGVGRTRLAEQLCDRADAQGLRALWARSWPGHDAPAMAPWTQIVQAATGDREPSGPIARVARTAPDRLSLFDGLAHRLGRSARDRPLLLVLDDFDGAAIMSTRFLEFLAPELPRLPMLVVTITETAPASLVDHAHRVHLSGLDVDAVQTLLAATVGQPCGSTLAAAVHQATAGNPLLVHEIARHTADGPDDAAGGFAAAEVLDRALRRLPAGSRPILAAASLLGHEFDATLLAAVTDADAASVGQVLAAAQQAGFVAPAGDRSGRWAFVHLLWRETSGKAASPTERADVHLRGAHALEDSYGTDAPAHAAELARLHLGAGDKADPRAAARWAEQAGDNARAELAWEDAAEHYRRALEVVGPSDDGRARLLLALGRALRSAGDTDAARSWLEQAAALARAGDRSDDLARAALALAAPLEDLEPGSPDPAAVPLLEEALAALGPSALRAHIGARLAMILGSGVRIAPETPAIRTPERPEVRLRHRRLATDAVVLARQLGDERALAAALASRCHVLAGPAHRQSRLDDADELVGLAARSGDLETELVGRRVRIVALLEGRLVDTVAAEVAAFASIVEHLAQPRLAWMAALWHAMLALLQGRFAECERRNHEALTLGRRARSGRAEALATVQFFGLRVAQDRLVELEAPTRALAAHPDEKVDSGATHVCLLGLLGRDGEACSELSHLGADRFASIDDDDRRLAALALLAEQAATLDQRAEAEVLYELLAPYAGCFAVEAMGSVCHGSVSRHLGLLAHALGLWDDADRHFRRALDDNESAGAPLMVAHTRSQWSALLRARDVLGDWERGLELLIGAESIYRRLGVDRLADEARRILARSHEPPASERSGSGNTFRQDDDGWSVSYGGVEARVPDSLGMRDLAVFLANPGRSFHVADLAAGVFAGGVGPAGQRPRAVADVAPGRPSPDVEAQTRAEYRTRLGELDQADATGDPVQVSLARAERDFIKDELAEGGTDQEPVADPLERARRTVAARIRLSLDRIEAAHPPLGRHLRHSVRTGTFCSYEPEIQTNWPTPGSRT